jgi:hypothetical protein
VNPAGQVPESRAKQAVEIVLQQEFGGGQGFGVHAVLAMNVEPVGHVADAVPEHTPVAVLQQAFTATPAAYMRYATLEFAATNRAELVLKLPLLSSVVEFTLR